jgi:hypothetical protein
MPNEFSTYSDSYGGKKDKTLSHGLNAGQLDKLHDLQKRGYKIATMKGNIVPTYEFEEHQKNLIHVEIIIPDFDQTTGENRSVKWVTTYHQVSFLQAEKVGFGNKKVTILHDPRKEGDELLREADGKFINKKDPQKVL